MNLKRRSQALKALYQEFRADTADQMSGAVCTIGCSDCCTNVGEVYATTLEGILIFDHLKRKNPRQKQQLLRRIADNKTVKEQHRLARCAFLNENGSCAVYPVRPFSCRRLYSVRRCGPSGPTLHRQAWEAGERIRRRIHLLDDCGYGGHLSYILTLLLDPWFRHDYLAGKFEPAAIEEFAGSHGIVINRWVEPRENLNQGRGFSSPSEGMPERS
ncbi:MAG: hypothetical protein AUK55_10300 [Syntrophobacteraceae bacterium CG2_30_61_12]|nr:MAG: hypothetical protein AUK55_10300 [Syntrophobacteraceae bacterium CG2_30_61_12]